MRILDLILAAVGVAALYGGYLLFSQPGTATNVAEALPQRLPVVEVALVERADVEASVNQTALLKASSEVPVTTELAGRVIWINERFQLGQRLQRGERIFELDATRLETDVIRAEADISAAEAERERLEKELTRISTLAERNISSQAALATTTANLAAAEAQLKQRNAALLSAELAQRQATITAPFDAVVAQETLSLGQFLQPGTEVGRLVAADEAELLVRLNAEQLYAVEQGEDLIGRRVTVTATDGSGVQKPGVISRIALTNEAATQTTGVLVTVSQPFDTRGGVFRINSLFDVSIPLPGNSDRLLSVPVAAVQTGDRIWGVVDGALTQIPAVLDRRAGDRMILRSGSVEVGMVVVTTRLPNAIEGLKVRVSSEGAQAALGESADQ
ncbi:efflux RND transporter periplasmic adaptor subunit [Yoonia sp. SDW83-1]|uniref:efflux RND transporter periplasmic adaptor subunit n=1 Tax=Yoonia sp. SDW83-1 TaxID=3366945 RepID=UPI00398C408C